ncbi:MAG: hypothetical protein EBT47_14180 [Chloroflexi bacterium]|nr:hypothetical protein [Chloroflexota bacterium]
MKPAEDINDLASDVGVLTVRPRMFGLDDLVSWAGNSVEALRSVSSMFRVDARFQSVSMSSRTDGHPPMGPNGLFIAIRGTQRDGHDFVADAFANGAIAALVDHIPANLEKHVSDGRIVVISANPDRLDHKVRRVGNRDNDSAAGPCYMVAPKPFDTNRGHCGERRQDNHKGSRRGGPWIPVPRTGYSGQLQ